MNSALHQLVHTLSYGDAISTEVIALQRALRGVGLHSEIFALHEHPLLAGMTKPLAALESCAGADLLLHYSLGSPLNEAYRNWRTGRRTLVYHNITPAHFFQSINPRVAADIERGIAELPELCAISDARWADSKFNAEELRALGFESDVLDLPIEPGRWNRPRNEGIYAAVKATPGIHVLHVGRVAPNKSLQDVIKSFWFLHRYLQPESTLWIAGIDTDTELYSFGLRRLVTDLGLEPCVRFLGGRSDEELRALYEACSVYLCMSEHEGFCLPLIEAMHFGLPVVAFGAGAVPDTVGTGGVVVFEKRYPEIAAVLEALATDAALRAQMIQRGRERVAECTFERFAARVRELLVLPGAVEAHAAESREGAPPRAICTRKGCAV